MARPTSRPPRRALLVWPCALALTSAAVAGPVEVPPVDAPLNAPIEALGTASLAPAPTLSAPAPAAAPAAALLSPAALAVAAPLAAPATSEGQDAPRFFAMPAGRPVFGRRGAAPTAAAPSDSGEDAWSQASELFDAASAARAAGLPDTPSGRTLARLRRAAATSTAGPAAIPGMAQARWDGPAGGGRSGETSKLLIGGKTWFLKRLGRSPDPGIDSTPVEQRALNEVGLALALRRDAQLSSSFAVSPRVFAFRDGKDVYVLSEGLPAVGDGDSRRHDLSPQQRADAAILQLALGLGDMHGADVLPLGAGRYGLIDFEKLAPEPLAPATAHEIDDQIMLKNFPLVDRLSDNDPAVYRARFDSWRSDYEAGGRARLDSALAEAGWPRARRESYLAAVDRNLQTYWERLQPYLDYANDWHRRILAARAQAERAPPKRKGLLNGLFGSGR